MPRRSTRTAALQAGWLASQVPAARRFRDATADAEAAQHQRLRDLLTVLAPSALGRELGLDRVTGPDAFQAHVPLGDYPSHQPWIDRVAAGESDVMTTEPVEILERTGGTGGALKLIPYTARLRAEFAEAVGAWMVDLHRHRPGLLGTRSYWSVSRATRVVHHTEGGVQVGFQDDAAYFGPVTRWALGRLMAVPSTVSRAHTLDDWRLQTATHLVGCADLGLISVWSPSFLTVLLDWIGANPDRVRPTLSRSAARRLDRALGPDGVDGAVLWPRLKLVSAWGDGFARTLVDPMMDRFPGVAFQPKGVLATEGVLSFPLSGQDGSALAVTAHGIELEDVEDGTVVWPHQARLGARYRPRLTTGGGLVRYALPDVVEVVGFTGQVPRIRLVGRADKASDLVGEKLSEDVVAEALGTLWTAPPGFAMLLPVTEPAGYVLVVDRQPPAPADVERALSVAYHYAYARELEQLAPVRVVALPDAWSRWESAVEGCGFVLGEQKPGALEVRPQVASRMLA